MMPMLTRTHPDDADVDPNSSEGVDPSSSEGVDTMCSEGVDTMLTQTVRGFPLIAVMIHVIAASTLDYHSEVDTIGH